MTRAGKIRTKALLFLLFGFSFLSVCWVISKQNSFVFDDVTLLSDARFTSYQGLFHFLPAASYNDRPVRMLFNKMLNDMFGLNYMLYHLVFVAIHLLNVALVYRIGRYLFHTKSEEKDRVLAILAAAVFGIYPTSLMAVSWISSTCDLLCCLFVLLAVLCYLKAKGSSYSLGYAILFLFFFYLSLRSKEMSLILPLLLLLYEFGVSLHEKRKVRIHWYLWAAIGFMLFYAVLLFLGGRNTIPPDNPYYQDFHLSTLFGNAFRYLFLYFDWGNSGYAFASFSAAALPGVLLFAAVTVYAIVLAIRKRDFTLLLSIVSIGVSLAVVLPLVHMRQRLYLYLPSVFIGFCAGFFLEKLSLQTKRDFLWETALVLTPCFYLVSYTPGMIGYRNSWLSTCQSDAASIAQIQRLKKPVKNSTIYIKGASNGYNIFFYGPGNSLRLFFDDATLKPVLVNDFPENPKAPYVFLQYENGNISETKRDSTLPYLLISSVYPTSIDPSTTKNADGSLNVGVVCDSLNAQTKIAVNGDTLDTIMGDTFLSAVVPKSMLSGNVLTVKITDLSTKQTSAPVKIKIQH